MKKLLLLTLIATFTWAAELAPALTADAVSKAKTKAKTEPTPAVQAAAQTAAAQTNEDKLTRSIYKK